MKKVTRKNSISLGGQLVPWSFVWRVHGLCGKDWDSTIDCFWKAQHCTGANGVQRYIMSGLKQKERSARWMLTPSRERESGRMESLRDWWLGLYKRRRRADEGEGCGAEFAAMLEQLVKGMDLTAAIGGGGRRAPA
jgi:hypothetical protein